MMCRQMLDVISGQELGEGVQLLEAMPFIYGLPKCIY